MKRWLILLTMVFLAIAISLIIVWASYRVEPLSKNAKADLIVVEKSNRRMSLYANGILLREYKVALGRIPIGPKEREGDHRTPEGHYHIDYRKFDSGFHRALHISYPSVLDMEVAHQKGVSPGGAIMLHGMRNGFSWLGNLHRLADWTAGCVAVTDWEIEEIWRVVSDGTPIEIKP